MENGIFWPNLNSEEIQSYLKSDEKNGLPVEEALKRLKEQGLNRLPEKKDFSALKIFYAQFSSFIVWFLIGAGIIAGFLGEWIDAVAIVVIVIFNALLGFVQEYRAEKSLAALKKLGGTSCKAIRGGEKQMVPMEEVVPGDLIILEAGDRIPADGRIVKSFHLQAQEAALTGESLPVEKTAQSLVGNDIALGDRKNMVFKGCSIVSGKGFFFVTATGKDTELGKIAQMLQETKKDATPLQKKLAQLGKKLIWICLMIVAGVFFMSILLHISWITAMLTALSLAVAAVPEGLPAVVTIALAAGVARMVQRQALIRKLPSIETLGCATVICSDKTGTLTRNEMQVKSIWTNDQEFQVTGEGYQPVGRFICSDQEIDVQQEKNLQLALMMNILCNNSTLRKENHSWEIVGDPTEGALIVAAKKADLESSSLQEQYTEVDEIPFDSERKMMSVLRKDPNGEYILCVKGAPDVILGKSTKYLQDGMARELDEEKRGEILQRNQDFAALGYRVLAVALRRQSAKSIQEEDLTFIGLMAMWDLPREEAKMAIAKCQKAGIRVVMITGDHYKTAEAIGNTLGIIDQSHTIINGADVAKMDDGQLQNHVSHVSVYSRASAEHKLRIIAAWKKRGEIVAMTGDGVNDAPAIKKADIGIAMGITGSDVTKEVADLIVLDDNFASIVNAVEEGRGIYRNILKFVMFLLAANIAEIMVIVFGLLFSFVAQKSFVILLPVQLLWINLVTDGFPAIALGIDPIDPNAMDRKPRRPQDPILTGRLYGQMAVVSLLICLGTLLAAAIGIEKGIKEAQTMAFATLVLLELIQAQIFRSQYGARFFANFWFPIAILSSLACQCLVLFHPFLQKIFSTILLNLYQWGSIVLICGIIGLLSHGISRLFSPAKGE